VFPTFLDVKVGDTIRIINDDDRGHTMGTFYVLAKSTLTYRFTTAGVFKGECTVNPGQEFVLTVTE
jgi:plastocyanin